MKTVFPGASGSRRRRGMTLPEVMVTSAIFALAMAGFLALHLFVLLYDQKVKLKLSSSNDARNALNRIAADVRGAGIVRVGNGDSSIFTAAAFGQPQTGNALQIHPYKTDTNTFIRYYRDPDDELLKRLVTGQSEVVIARSVTNTLVFGAEDGFGRVLSNNFNNRVISVTLLFDQDLNPSGAPRSGFLYDYYQIRTRVTRRALE